MRALFNLEGKRGLLTLEEGGYDMLRSCRQEAGDVPLEKLPLILQRGT